MTKIASIKIEKLVFPQSDKPALKNIDFEIEQGDFIVITGGVASGKSALLHTLTGAVPKYHNAELTGKVTVMGQDIQSLPLNRMADYLGYMMQEPQNQIISQDIYEDVAFGLGNLEIPLPQIDQRVKETLAFVGLKGYEKRKTAALSGGQAQRVVLAGVLALNAPILILDQPTAELDPQGRAELYQRLGELNKTCDLTIILVMDRIEEVIKFATRVFYMAEGEIIKQYSPEAYYQEHRRRLQGKIKDHRPLPTARALEKETVVKIDRASYQYRNNIIACRAIDLSIHQGDFLAVIGLNGSGKSTLAKMLIGLLQPSSGEIKIFGMPVNKRNLTQIRSRTGFLFQNPDYQIFAGTVAEEVGFSLQLRSEAKEVIAQKVDACLEFVGLQDYRELHPQRLSRGQRQLLALASILVSDPDLIIADEPTTGLDENQGYLIMDRLAQLSRAGKTVMVITHDLTMARYYSNRLAVMDDHQLKLDIFTADLPEHLQTLAEIGLDFTTATGLEEV